MKLLVAYAFAMTLSIGLASSHGQVSSGDVETDATQSEVAGREAAESKPRDIDPAASEAYQELGKRLRAGEWDGLAELMTTDAQQLFKTMQVIGAVGSLTINVEKMPADFREPLNSVREVVKALELDDVFKDPEEAGPANPQLVRSNLDSEKLQAVIKRSQESDNAWEIAGKLWQVQRAVPHAPCYHCGTVEKHFVADDRELLHVRSGSIAGTSLQNVFVVEMKKEGDQWKFHAIDTKRTKEETEKVVQGMIQRAEGKVEPESTDSDPAAE